MVFLFLFMTCHAGIFFSHPSIDFDVDLIFAYQMLQENHPGPYNSLDSTFSKRLEDHFYMARQKLKVSETNEEKKKVLKEFGQNFHDSHLWIRYESAVTESKIIEEKVRLFGIEALPNDIFWIHIPTFFPSSPEQEEAFSQIIQKLPSLREQTIVFDLRGNRGGSRLLGTELIKSLYGHKYAEKCLSELYRRSFNEWRLSAGNLEHMEGWMIPVTMAQLGEDHFATRKMNERYQKMKKAFLQGEHSYFELVYEEISYSPSATNPIRGPIFVVMDKNCYSASLMFIDELRGMQSPVILIGETTGADSMYMELRRVPLPSGTGEMGFPIRVYVGPFRGHNISYEPDIQYNGNLLDTKELQSFVGTLSGE
jgi:hypothetical protein